MLIKKGTVLTVDTKRKGIFIGIATEDFDDKKGADFLPIALHQDQPLHGASQVWERGDSVPCRREWTRIKVYEELRVPYKGQQRGQLTSRIVERSLALLGYAIDTTELRLMAYFQYVIINDRRIDLRKVNDTDINILARWSEAGYIDEDKDHKLTCTKAFWDAVSEIIWLGYVDLSEPSI